MPATIIPSSHNYHIGKGVVSFKEDGTATYQDLGNAPAFVYTPSASKKEHFTSRTGIKTKDYVAITSVAATIKITLDEITDVALQYFALAQHATGSSPGHAILNGLTKTQYQGQIKVVGTNAIGQQVDFTAEVMFVPSGDFSMITDSDDFSRIVIDADVIADATGSFGQWTVRDTTTL